MTQLVSDIEPPSFELSKKIEKLTEYSHYINSDADGNYLLEVYQFSLIGRHLLFTGDEKIAEIDNEGQEVTLKIISDKKTKIIGPLKASILYVTAKNIVEFTNEIDVNYLNVDALSVCFNHSVHVIHGAIIQAKDVLTFKETFSTGYATLAANKIYIESDVQLRDDSTINAVSSVNFNGECRSKNALEIQAGKINLSNIMRIATLSLISKTTNIKSQAKIYAHNIQITANEVDHAGLLNIKNICTIDSDIKFFATCESIIHIAGRLHGRLEVAAFNGDVNVKKGCEIYATRIDLDSNLTLGGHQKITVDEWHCFENTNFKILHSLHDKRSIIQINKRFDSKKGSSISIDVAVSVLNNFQSLKNLPVTFSSATAKFAGKLKINYSHLTGENLTFMKHSQVEMNFSYLKHKHILLDGNITCHDSQLNAQNISHAEHCKTDYRRVLIKKTLDFFVRGSTTFHDSVIKSKIVNFYGLLNIDGVAIKGETINLKPTTLKAENLIVTTQNLSINANEKCHFKKIVADIITLETRGKVRLQNSRIVTTGNKISSNHGLLELCDSFITTEGPFVNERSGTLSVFSSAPSTLTEADDHKHPVGVKTKYLYNSGKVDLSTAELIASTIAHVGISFKAVETKIAFEKDLLINANENFLLEEKSVLIAKEGQVVVKKGEFHAHQSAMLFENLYTLKSATLRLDEAAVEIGKYGVLFAPSTIHKSSVRAEKVILFNESTSDHSHYDINNFDVMGKFTNTRSIFNCKENIIIRSDGKFLLEASSVFGKAMQHQGYLSVKSASEATLASDNAKDKKHPDTIFALEELYSSFGSKIEGENLLGDIDTWNQHGPLSITGMVRAKGKYFRGTEKIEAGIQLDLSYDSLINENIFKSDHVKLSSILQVNSGFMQAHVLESTSLANINFGFTSAYDHQQTSLISFNAGFSLPNLPKFDYIFSVKGLKSCLSNIGKVATSTFLPEFSRPIQFVSALTNTYSMLQDVYDQSDGFNIEHFKKMRPAELVNFAFKTKNLVMSGYQVCKDIIHYKDHLQKTITDMDSRENPDSSDNNKFTLSNYALAMEYDIQKRATQMRLRDTAIASMGTTEQQKYNQQQSYKFAETTLAAIGSQYNTSSLVDENIGVIIGQNIHAKSFYSHNALLKVAVQSHTNHASHYINSGIQHSVSGANYFSGNTFGNSGFVSASQGTYLKYHKINLSAQSQHDYAGWQIESDSLTVGGNHRFSESKISTDQFQVEASTKNIALDNSELVIADDIKINFDLSLKKASMKANSLVFETGSHTTMSDISTIEAKNIHSDGEHNIKNSSITATDKLSFSKSAKNILNVASYTAGTISDASELIYTGEHNIFKTTHFEHTGFIKVQTSKAEKNSFYLETDTALFSGRSAIDNGVFTVKEMPEVASFALGVDQYHAYQFSDSLRIACEENINLAGSYNRLCDLTLSGNSINSHIDFHGNYNLGLIAISGDLTLNGDINVRNFDGEAKKNIYDLADIYTNENINMMAHEGTFFQNGSALNAYDINLLANSIKLNSSKPHLKAKHCEPELILDTNGHNDSRIERKRMLACKKGLHKDNNTLLKKGFITSRHNTLLEATSGNFENQGMNIQGENYCQILSADNLDIHANEKSKKTKFGTMKQYEPVIISGGNMGVFLKANNKVVIDASTIMAKGLSRIEGTKGVEFLARSNTYVSKDETKEKALGFGNTHIIETDTQVQGSQIVSINNKNIITSSEGDVLSVASQFVSNQGTDIYAYKNILLYSLKTQNKRYESKESWWGINKNKQEKILQDAIPTLIYDHGDTVLHAYEADVSVKGVVIAGNGDLTIKAGHDIFLTRDILNQTLQGKSRSLQPSFFGMGAYNIWKQGGNFWQSLAAEDPTLAKLYALIHSDSTLSALTNLMNVGINGFNTANSLLYGMQAGGLGVTGMQRYGLGDGQVFNPTINFTYSRMRNSSSQQTLGPGYINRASVNMQAGNEINLENGMSVEATKDLFIVTPKLSLKAANLAATAKARTDSLKLGVTASGEIVNVGAGYATNKSQSSSHVNSSLKAGFHTHLEVDAATISGGNIESNTLSGYANTLNIVSLADETKASSKNIDVNSSGAISAGYSREMNSTVHQPSGMHIKSGINNQEKSFRANEVSLTGAFITSDGSIDSFANKITAATLKDTAKKISLGLSFNVKDLQRLSAQPKPITSYCSEPAIASIGVNGEIINYKAKQSATISGAGGTYVDPKISHGILNTAHPSTLCIESNFREHMNLDVPITNQHYIQEAKKNILRGTSTLWNSYKKPSPILAVPIDTPHSVSDSPLIDTAPEEKNVKSIKASTLKLRTKDVRLTGKKGRNGTNQLADLDDGRYTNLDNAFQKIVAKNNARRIVTTEFKVLTKQTFLLPTQRIPWQSNFAFSNDYGTVNPALLFDSRGIVGTAEYNPLTYQGILKVEAGFDLRLNLVHGSYDLQSLGKLSYVADLASAQSLARFSATNKHVDMGLEVGVLGPNTTLAYESPEFYLLGFTFSSDFLVKAGVGCKAAAGAGLQVDKKIKLYSRCGLFYGVGVEIEPRVNVGLDKDLPQRYSKQVAQVASTPLFSEALNKIDQQQCRLAAEEPSSFWGGFWNRYQQAAWQDLGNDVHEAVENIAQGTSKVGINSARG